MSESFAVVPLSDEVRAWLSSEGISNPPRADGRLPTLQELEAAVGSIPGVAAIWAGTVCELSTPSGARTSLLVHGATDPDHCNFHFRGGDQSLVEVVVRSLSSVVGPMVVCAHSGGSLAVVEPF